jgi:hypothetical protein
VEIWSIRMEKGTADRPSRRPRSRNASMVATPYLWVHPDEDR